MGNLFYGAMNEPVVIPDVLLAHLQRVITTKFRRGECFSLTWQHAGDEPGGRTTIWLQPSIPLRFVADAREAMPIDVDVLHRLAESASSARGLVVDLTAPVDELSAGLHLRSA